MKKGVSDSPRSTLLLSRSLRISFEDLWVCGLFLSRKYYISQLFVLSHVPGERDLSPSDTVMRFVVLPGSGARRLPGGGLHDSEGGREGYKASYYIAHTQRNQLLG